jgi:hypothetical protein
MNPESGKRTVFRRAAGFGIIAEDGVSILPSEALRVHNRFSC